MHAVCTVRTCARVCWLMRDFCDRCENTRLDAGPICFWSDPICPTRSWVAHFLFRSKALYHLYFFKSRTDQRDGHKWCFSKSEKVVVPYFKLVSYFLRGWRVNSQGTLIIISCYFCRQSTSSTDVQGTLYEPHSIRSSLPLPYAQSDTCLKRSLNTTWTPSLAESVDCSVEPNLK